MRVLVAEDDRVTSTLVTGLLESWGYEVVLARDGNEATARLLAPNAPRIALIDWTMPGQSGLEVCRRVRSDAGQGYTYLIMVTARGERRDTLQGLNAGADDYLVKPIFAAELRARIEIGKRIVTLQEQLLCALENARYQAGHDALTGLWNRRAILEQLGGLLAQSDRRGSPLGLLLVDIDYFKTINDSRGHQLGDAAIRHAASILRTGVRASDLVGRYGGDEFLIVAPDSGADELMQVGQRVVDLIAHSPLTIGADSIPLSVSVGAATLSGSAPRSETSLIGAADSALYEAKKAGRGRVCLQVVTASPGLDSPACAGLFLPMPSSSQPLL